jgi:hypothetical protein
MSQIAQTGSDNGLTRVTAEFIVVYLRCLRNLWIMTIGGTVRRIRRTEVTVETDEIVVIRSSQTTVVPLCPQCCDAVPMITADQAREVASTNTRAIYRWVEAGLIHNIETPDGVVFVCPRSLFLAGLMPQLPAAKPPPNE